MVDIQGNHTIAFTTPWYSVSFCLRRLCTWWQHCFARSLCGWLTDRPIRCTGDGKCVDWLLAKRCIFLWLAYASGTELSVSLNVRETTLGNNRIGVQQVSRFAEIGTPEDQICPDTKVLRRCMRRNWERPASVISFDEHSYLYQIRMLTMI